MDNDQVSQDQSNDLNALLSMVDMSSPVNADGDASLSQDICGGITSTDAFKALPLDWQAELESEGRKAYGAAVRAGRTPAQAACSMADVMTNRLDALVAKAENAARPKSVGARGVEICEAGRDRSRRDVEALTAAGFTMQAPLFDRGTMVADLGVAMAHKARKEYDELPLVDAACASLRERIAQENRRIVEVPARDITMAPTGRVLLGIHGEHTIGEHAFAGLVERLGYGGAAYLSAKCPPDLRAHNVNAQRDRLAAAENIAIAAQIDKRWEDGRAGKGEPRKIAARVRGDAASPEIFAAVSSGYRVFDADEIADAFAQAMPSDARGTVRYDPSSTGVRFEALFHSTVAPEHFVAGEVFRTGIRVRSSDSGDGSIVVRAIAYQNLCLNMIIIDRACREIARIRHVGSVEKLASQFRQAMVKAKGAIEPFMRQWSLACEENLAAKLRGDGVKIPSSTDEIMRGIFASMLAAKQVRFPRVPGKGREGMISDLVAAWREDRSSATNFHHGVTRAAVVNAITRVAQNWVRSLDPWATDAIEVDAAKLLWGTAAGAVPLGFIDKIADETDEIIRSTDGAASA